MCLESWRDIGLPVIAVQTKEEIKSMRKWCNWPEFVACEELTTEYDRPTQRVSTLIRAGAEQGIPFFVINSDIEMRQNPEAIDAGLSPGESLVIGVRYNHGPGDRRAATREPAGLDCFLMTPAMAATVPDLPFGIGKPGWDYWLPHHFRAAGHEIRWFPEPLLFHESHDLGWNREDWKLGAGWLRQHYGLTIGHDSDKYRLSLDRG